MAWFFRFLNSSIGKKIQVALAGLLLCVFLVAHLGGNLFLYKSRDAFNHYAGALEQNPLLPLAEAGLAFLFLLHIANAIWVTFENRAARSASYVKTACAGGKTIGSATMAYSGILILIFLIIHIKTFRLAPENDDLYQIVMTAFHNKWYAGFYVVSMIALGLHLSHGFRSGFQTFGLDHPKYNPIVLWAGWAFAAAIAGGFASIAIWAGFL